MRNPIYVGLLAVTMMSACQAKSEETAPVEAAAVAPAPEVALETAAPNASAQIDPDSDAALAEYGSHIFPDAGWDVSLKQLRDWAFDHPNGYARFGIDDQPVGRVIFVGLEWQRDDGNLADYGFVFRPNRQDNRLELVVGFNGEQRISKQEADEVLSGIILDMYHQGYFEPG